MDPARDDLDTAKVVAEGASRELIMVARDEDDADAFADLSQGSSDCNKLLPKLLVGRGASYFGSPRRRWTCESPSRFVGQYPT